MTWTALLLADRSPCLRAMVLREIFGRTADDPELRELLALRAEDPLVTGLLALQGPDGAWQGGDLAWPARSSKLRATALALMRLGFLGFGAGDAPVARGAGFVFSLQRPDGAWDLHEPLADVDENATYSMIPLQTALPLRALAACGYAADPRAEKAYEWLLAQRLDDGAWPTGIAAGNYGRVAGYRRLPHSRWGCRSNTTGALACLALHPQRRTGPAVRRALDLLLGRETREESTLGFEVARLIGAEPASGFLTYYARFDPAHILELCWRVGATAADERVAGLVAHVRDLQGAYGLWDYPARPQAARWVTYDLLRSLSRVQPEGDWLSDEPSTPFQAYGHKARRY